MRGYSRFKYISNRFHILPTDGRDCISHARVLVRPAITSTTSHKRSEDVHHCYEGPPHLRPHGCLQGRRGALYSAGTQPPKQ